MRVKDTKPRRRQLPVRRILIGLAVTLGSLLAQRHAWAAHLSGLASMFWIGNGVNFNTTNWSNTSGGASNGLTPGAGDDVIFDQNSPGNCTLTASTNVRSLDFRGGNPDGAHDFAHTFTHNSAVTLTIGTTTSNTVVLRMSSPMTYTRVSATTSSISLQSAAGVTETVTTNGKIFGTVGFNSASGGYQLQDALNINVSAQMTLTGGTLDLNGQHHVVGKFVSSSTNVRTLTFNGAIVEITATSGTVWNCAVVTNFTLNSVPGTIYLNTGALGQVTFAGGGKTYDTFNLSTLTTTISGSNTFGAASLVSNQVIFIAGTTQTFTSVTGIALGSNAWSSTVGGSTYTVKCAAGVVLTGSGNAVRDCIASGGVPFYAGSGASLINTTNWAAANPPLRPLTVMNATGRSASW